MIVLQISLFGGIPRGQRESMLRLRIQIAAKGVNDFTKELSTSEAHTVHLSIFFGLGENKRASKSPSS